MHRKSTLNTVMFLTPFIVGTIHEGFDATFWLYTGIGWLVALALHRLTVWADERAKPERDTSRLPPEMLRAFEKPGKQEQQERAAAVP